GSVIPLEMTGAVWMEGGKAFSTGIIRDVSSWKGLLDDLRVARETEARANQAKSIFLATMSHEIRTPMNGILGMAELLALSGLTPQQQEQVQVIDDSGKQLIAIINNILDFSKIEAGRLELDVVDFDSARLFNILNRMFGALARKKRLRYESRFGPGLPRMLRGDPTRLHQILTNLLGNAVKFTDAGGVEMEVGMIPRGEGHCLEVRIRDTGVGMDADQIDYLFLPFTQADGSTTRRFGGTGLGLSITKKLIELMGGTIRVSSQPGRGSDFHLELPIALPRAGSGQPVDLHGNESRKNLDHVRVLLVEDDVLNQVVLSRMFRQLGIEVTLAFNGQEGLDAVEEGRLDVVFMDCHMPVMDGLTACRELRAREARQQRPPLPVIALTAMAMASDREACLQAGMSDFLSKPTTLQGLEEVLLRWAPV
ncbi:MAG: response regulator, partial [Magnetococcales bacterium]|nr:response regulator [Magnetococcales bacterium]